MRQEKRNQEKYEIKQDAIPNLWNAVLNKTKRVITFIESLEPPYNNTITTCKYCSIEFQDCRNTCPQCNKPTKTEVRYDLTKFDVIKEEALSKPTANEMLETIGYINHKTEPRIYEAIRLR